MYDINFMWNIKKKATIELIYKTEAELYIQKINLLGGKEKRDKLEDWDLTHTYY